MSSFDGNWEDPADNAANIAWVRGSLRAGGAATARAARTPISRARPTRSADALARNAYGANTARLRAIKKQYDPDNFFRINPNILPE